MQGHRSGSKSAMSLLAALLLLLPSTPVVAQDVRDCGRGLIDTPHTPSGTPLLGRLAFEYTNNDHHITQILIAPGFTPSTMRLGFHDKNLDDRFCYSVTHFGVADPRIRLSTRSLDICSGPGRCTVQLDKPAGDFVFVLVGFQLTFQSGIDHHIDEVAILENNGNVTVAYNDKNDDDLFLWSLKYAYVPRELFRELGVSSGTREHGETTRAIPGGVAVLRGFRFNFEPHFTSGGDHHIKKIGLLPTQSSPQNEVFVFYEDKNGDDGFDWEYRWAILN